MTTPKKPPEHDPPNKKGGLSDKGANAIIYTVAAIWASAMAASIITSLIPQLPDYQPPEYIHGAFLAVVGTALALRGRGKSE